MSGSRAVRGPARSIELTIVLGSDVRPWRYPPRLDFQYGDWWRAEYEAGDFAPWTSPNPDLAVVITSVLGAAEVLVGPMPAELLDPVPRSHVNRAMRDSLTSLLADLESDTRNVLLTLARMWFTIATGEIRSKDTAAEWAIAKLPASDAAPLTRARQGYLSEEWESWSDSMPEVQNLAARLVVEIESTTN